MNTSQDTIKVECYGNKKYCHSLMHLTHEQQSPKFKKNKTLTPFEESGNRYFVFLLDKVYYTASNFFTFFMSLETKFLFYFVFCEVYPSVEGLLK